MSEPVIVALIGAVFSIVVGVVGAASGFVLARRMQPSAIRASDAAAAESIATAAATVQATGDKYIDGQAKLFDRWEKSEQSKIEILEQFGALKADFLLVTQRAESAETRAIGCEAEVIGYKTRYDALELKYDALETRTQDYPQTIFDLREKVKRLEDAAEVNATTNAANAAASLVRANTAALAAGGTPAVASELPSATPEPKPPSESANDA